MAEKTIAASHKSFRGQRSEKKLFHLFGKTFSYVVFGSQPSSLWIFEGSIA